MTNSLVLKAISDSPWAITAEAMARTLFVASRGQLHAQAGRDALAARQGKPLDNTRRVTTRDRVAVVPIEGVLCRKAPMLADISGATSYEILRRDIQTALDDTTVDAILLSVHSPGGEADGCNELARFILQASAVKPIWAYCSLAASGGLWLAVAASRVVVAPTAFMGSIGVRQTIVDYSAIDEAMGIRTIELVSSRAPDKRGMPIDDELLARYQQHIDDLEEIFVDFVAECRATTPADVAEGYGRGDVMIGGRAVAAGMADELGDFESTLAALSAQVQSQQIGAATARATASHKRTTDMQIKKDTTPAAIVSTPAASMGGEKCDGCGADMGPQSKAYCAQCFDDDDDDSDEEEARALGLEPTASRSARLERIGVLATLERDLVAATGASSSAELLDKVKASATELATAKMDTQRRELRATLSAGLDRGTLTLGAIQKKIGVQALRGPQRTAWSQAMGGIKTVDRDSVLEAACAAVGALGAEDLEAIADFVKEGEPVAAATFKEPERNATKEAAALDETQQRIDAAVKLTKATINRSSADKAKK